MPVELQLAEAAALREPPVARPDVALHRRSLRLCLIHYSDFGLDSRVQRHAYAAARRGDEVHSIGVSEPRVIPVGRGVVHLHRVVREKVRYSPSVQLGGYIRFSARAAVRVGALQRPRRFDVVEVHNMPNALALSAFAATAVGTPMILDVQDTFPELFATKFGRRAAPFLPLVRLEERLSARGSSAVVCVTEEARARLVSRGIACDKSRVVMNSPDESLFGPPRRPVLVPRAGPVRAVYHGGIAPRYGVETLIHAFRLLQSAEPRTRLDVHGSFNDFEDFGPLCDDLSPKRVFIAQAPTPFRDIPGVLADKHIGIVPTLHDGFTQLLLPVKLLELVHMGIPVIASRLPTIENYFGDGEIRFVEPGSPDALAEAVREICAMPEVAAARAARATERLAAIDWPGQRASYLRLIDEMAAVGNGRHP